MARDSDYGAFMEKFLLQTHSSEHQLPLSALTFSVKDVFDVEGRVTGFGNPDWARTRPAATSTAPAVLAILRAGATCVGKNVMDEMAHGTNGENKHYGTPINPFAPDRVPGGSSSGSAVAVAAGIVDFSLGTDTGGSVRVPASFCGIFGFRPSHDVVSTSGVIPMAQSFDTVGWFASDPVLLKKVGSVLLQLPNIESVRPTQLIIAEDCFRFSTIPGNQVEKALAESVEKLFGGHILKHASLGDYVKDKVPSLKSFMSEENAEQDYDIPSLTALFKSLRLLQRYEIKNNHGEWVKTVKPDLCLRTAERIREALETTDENIDLSQCEKGITYSSHRSSGGTLSSFSISQDYGVLAIPMVREPPLKLQTPTTTLEVYQAGAGGLLSIAGVSGFCEVSIPLGKYGDLPVSVSLLAKHGSDGFLLNLIESLYDTLKDQVGFPKR